MERALPSPAPAQHSTRYHAQSGIVRKLKRKIRGKATFYCAVAPHKFQPVVGRDFEASLRSHFLELLWTLMLHYARACDHEAAMSPRLGSCWSPVFVIC